LSKEIKIPDIGTSDKVDVIEVLVKPGDSINVDDPILTLESEKASMDVPAPVAGVVKSVAVKVGDKVGEGDVVLILEGESTAKEESPATKAESKAAPKQATSSKQTINFPDLGTDTEVDVIEILVKDGDTLEADAPIVTLESEKASMDVPSPVSGKLLKLLVKVGDKVKTGDKLAEVETTEAVAEASKQAAKADTCPRKSSRCNC